MSDVQGPEASQRPDLSIIICTLNEGAAIRGVIEELCTHLDRINYEIIVVDDNSSDQTQAEVTDVMRHNANVRLHVRTNERGLSSAAIKGWDIAYGRYLGVMDGDGQHDPVAIRALADMILKGDMDLVCVSRYLGQSDTGLSFFRDLGSKAATFATGLVLKVPLTDPMSGCFMMSRDYYMSARPKLAGVGFKILVDIAASSPVKPRFAEVKAALRQRHGGQSKLDLRVVLDLLALLIEKATNGLLPARFVLFLGVGVTGVFIYAFVLIGCHMLLNVHGSIPLYRYQLRYDDLTNYGLAIWLSMTWNFFINNSLTFRDKRLKGWAIVRGLFGFYLACAIGAVFSLVLSIFAKDQLHINWLVAGVSAALLSGIWNYWASKYLSWGPQATKPKTPEPKKAEVVSMVDPKPKSKG